MLQDILDTIYGAGNRVIVLKLLWEASLITLCIVSYWSFKRTTFGGVITMLVPSTQISLCDTT